MDMLHPKAGLDLSREDWKIYSRNPVVPPQYIAKGAKVQNSLVGEGCNVYGDLEFSRAFTSRRAQRCWTRSSCRAP